MTLLHNGATVLFQGDSITDCGRARRSEGKSEDLGAGYPMLVAAWCAALHPELHLRFLNRGISGNRTRDLAQRWQRDCLDLRPKWVSLLIGINDTWRRYDSHEVTTAQQYETDYRRMLQSARDTLGARLILCEPFVLPTPPDRIRWREDLDPKLAIVRRLAAEFDALLVPLDDIFARAAQQRGDVAFWADDGVHPTAAGHALIAHAWLRAVEAL